MNTRRLHDLTLEECGADRMKRKADIDHRDFGKKQDKLDAQGQLGTAG
jgi:hypothetical protein